MLRAYVRCYAELNDHLPAERKVGTFMHAMDDHTTVSAMLKAISVPAKEVDLVLVNGESVELSHVIKHD